MRKKYLFLIPLLAVLVLPFVVSCGGNKTELAKNVFEKKASVYQNAKEDIAAAKEISVLNEINMDLEKQIEDIDAQCEAELRKIQEERVENADAYKDDEDAMKEARKAYDDAFIEKYLNIAG